MRSSLLFAYLCILTFGSFVLGQSILARSLPEHCQLPWSDYDTYLYFTDPATPKITYSIKTQFTEFYPYQLSKALNETGFQLLDLPEKDESKNACQWKDAGKVRKDGWTRGHISFHGPGLIPDVKHDIARIKDILGATTPSKELAVVWFLIVFPIFVLAISIFAPLYCTFRLNRYKEGDKNNADIELASMENGNVLKINDKDLPENSTRELETGPMKDTEQRCSAPPTYSEGDEKFETAQPSEASEYDMVSMKTGENYSVSFVSSSSSVYSQPEYIPGGKK
ncbi:hypothetical protein BCR34DRAFT_583548 [Clohesyomyces aquaticus]|uniref:SUR7/PalI family-domain-containing protein n=1 Tax=Clohesyomyces aquaticus TaxID=1231657 RepID=A0A1Y2A5A4_9PLEO|nr:hypothetical protein BCR34DRAFT_583548 [Clohesyomyces aquaticus]